ncbi:MAG TPA: molybdenum cofactor guanylyltransferase [bacterium]|nr:MAG: Molybdenum cofactor guanylyltransferase [bacterium ADurb.Bin236]HOY64590.1 molybdenum cofactor guanylyltransferase [bacterium]HPI77087.1 molybdenum cofactor guanylyltransferase [bacterium]HPN95674.1 molybdenum cofactor guanylyltransferase [bacterium]
MRTLILLMGGKSSRMGADKTRLELNGRPIIDDIIEKLSPYFPEIILSTNEPERYSRLGLAAIADDTPGQGPAGGLLSVMNAFPREQYQVAPCDTPFIDGATLARVFDLSKDSDAGIVFSKEGPQPLLSSYSIAARDAIERGISRGVFKIMACIEELRIRWISAADLGLDEDSWRRFVFNVNNPEDLEIARTMASDGGPG